MSLFSIARERDHFARERDHFVRERDNYREGTRSFCEGTRVRSGCPGDVYAVADPGGGGSRGSGPRPPFGPRCRLFNIGPKVGPPPPCFACRPKMDPTGGSRV